MSILPSQFGRRSSKPAALQEPISVDIWDPLEGFAVSTTAMNISPVAATQLDWMETPGAHVFITDMPGMKEEEEKVLRISGQRMRQGEEEKGHKWHRVERSSERFFRSVKLPQNTSTEGVRADLVDGVLTVTVPKENDKKPQRKLIKISG